MFKQILLCFINIFNKIHNKILFARKKVKNGKKITINGKIYVYGNKGRISLGNNVKINSSKNSNPIGGDCRTLLAAYGKGNIVIGNNVGISNSSIVSFDSIIIEDDVMIGGSVRIYDSDFHSVVYEERMKSINAKAAPIRIKKGSFIGAGSIILKGVSIGECSVIGAGSVVTRDVPQFEVWAGNPARFIKKVQL